MNKRQLIEKLGSLAIDGIAFIAIGSGADLVDRAKKVANDVLGRSDIIDDGHLYMKRWRFVHTRHGGVRVHNIVRSDQDRELHDHPFLFVSFILKGGYFEHTVDGRRTWYPPGSVVVRSADTLHRLELKKDGKGGEVSAWTFVLRGPDVRQWGFLTDHGWIPSFHFRNYQKLRDGHSRTVREARA